MSRFGLIAGIALVSACAVATASAQQPQTQRLAGTIEKVNGNMVLVKTQAGEATVTLADKALVVDVHKASLADIKEGSYIGSGAVPQADGSQKAVEVHIFAESQRGTGDGHRGNWDGAPGGTMTNGAVGNSVSSVDGQSIMVKYNLTDPALQKLAKIVHGADVAVDINIVPEAAGLKAIAHGFALVHGDNDHEKIRLETPLYDALYAWCQRQVAEGR